MLSAANRGAVVWMPAGGEGVRSAVGRPRDLPPRPGANRGSRTAGAAAALGVHFFASGRGDGRAQLDKDAADHLALPGAIECGRRTRTLLELLGAGRLWDLAKLAHGAAGRGLFRCVDGGA